MPQDTKQNIFIIFAVIINNLLIQALYFNTCNNI
jgi:hypothetical protein